jgi:hypothetical protein
MKIKNLILLSVLGIIIQLVSCNKDDDDIIPESSNNSLPSSIVLKDIPSGIFTMGGTTV